MKERLTVREKQSVAALAEELEVFRPGEAAMGDRALQVLEQLGIEYPHSYGFERDQAHRDHFTVAALTGRHIDLAGLRSLYETNLMGSMAYHPRSIEPAQRDRTFLSGQLRLPTPSFWTEARRLWAPHVRQAHDQLRVLICDGPAMLAWVGGFSREDFTWRKRDKLQLLVPSLRRRLMLERRLREAAVVHHALEAVLEALPGPAFLLDDRHRPLHRNLAAADTRVELSSLDLTPVASPGVPTHYLALSRPGAMTAPALKTFGRRHGLSAQETRVLAFVVQGRTNRAIALALQCSERTVEVHLTRVLDKTGGESRGAVVARFWRGGP